MISFHLRPLTAMGLLPALCFCSLCPYFLCLCLGAVRADDANPTQAGRGIGALRLGESRVAVHRDMGKPKEIYRLPLGFSAEYWGADSVRAFYQGGRLVQLSDQNLLRPLPGGITMQSSLSQVLARYPRLKKREYFIHGSGGGVVDYYDDMHRGIAFEFTRPLNPAPGENAQSKFHAVVIHRTGRPAIPDVGETPA